MNSLRLLAQDLVEKYFPFIGYIDLDQICFILDDNPKPKKSPVYKVSGITQSWVRDIINASPENYGKFYCISVYEEEWNELQKSQREWFMMKCLYSISPSLDGKIRSFEIFDYAFINEYFVRVGVGPYWELREDLPSLLDSNEPLPLILPMLDED